MVNGSDGSNGEDSAANSSLDDIATVHDPASNIRTKAATKVTNSHEITTTAIKFPHWSYLHLLLITDPPSKPILDDLTVKRYLTAALTQFLGITGASVSVDILKVERNDCWIRIPREDASKTIAAIGGWIGGNDKDGQLAWRVKDAGNWLGSLVGKQGIEKVWSG